jgi:hypothetical protein
MILHTLRNALEGGTYGLLLGIIAWVVLYFVGGLPCQYPQGPSFCSGVALPSFVEALAIGFLLFSFVGAVLTLAGKWTSG